MGPYNSKIYTEVHKRLEFQKTTLFSKSSLHMYQVGWKERKHAFCFCFSNLITLHSLSILYCTFKEKRLTKNTLFGNIFLTKKYFFLKNFSKNLIRQSFNMVFSSKKTHYIVEYRGIGEPNYRRRVPVIEIQINWKNYLNFLVFLRLKIHELLCMSFEANSIKFTV